jgi:hypothetical protein
MREEINFDCHKAPTPFMEQHVFIDVTLRHFNGDFINIKKYSKITKYWWGIMAHIYSYSNQEVEAGGTVFETLSQK